MSDHIPQRRQTDGDEAISLRTFMDFRFREIEAARQIAMNAMDERLKGMNEFRATIEGVIQKGMGRDEIQAIIQTLESKMDAAVSPLSVKVDSLRQTNWPLLMTFSSVVVTLVVGLFIVIGLKIDASEQPLGIALSELKTDSAQINDRMKLVEIATIRSSTADATSSSDRAQLNSRVAGNEERIGAIGSTLSASGQASAARLAEIETQFRAAQNIANLQFDHVEQMVSILWAKLFDASLPDTRFRPDMSTK